jgi:hypothetical protein
MFVCRSLDELQAFSRAYSAHGTIYEIVANRFQVSDMRFLSLGDTISHAWVNARNYWQGLGSANPPSPVWECLVELPVTIGHQLETI